MCTFFSWFKTNDRIYLVLEYCAGGDLAAYIHRHGKVSEPVAHHFMRQLGQWLHFNHLLFSVELTEFTTYVLIFHLSGCLIIFCNVCCYGLFQVY